MTWSLMWIELPRAGANSKPRHYKQKVQKMKDISKTWVLTGKLFEDVRRKKSETKLSTFEKTQSKKRTLKTSTGHGPRRQ